uniref:Protein LTV1 homolog n=1 Tax=Ceriodaphnia reticulata TaxID=302197 RepID=A0A4Y7LU96_9CRUS|nr:EOG090X08PQ [Ceriodaphnia reticulata]SVE73027.1 EOG090X08PQ [Ceriodaphnia reticulata]
MNQQDDGENGFELVDRPKEGNANEGPTPLPSWINPPTNLPLNLMSGPPHLVLPVGQLFPATSTPTVANSQFFTGLSGVQAQTGLSNLPILLPLSPISDNEPQQNPSAGTSALEIAVLESPTAPNMKDEAQNSGGDIDIAIASTKELKVSSVREAFQNVFGKATVKGYESQSAGVAAQPVGFASALQAARERIAPKTKKFIDKKNAVTFNLVHRSQKDPLAADEEAPQRVLVPIALKPDKPAASSITPKPKDLAKQKEEEAKLGIFYDDDYDYLQHLRDVTQTAEWELAEDSKNSRSKVKLPASVFQSEVEEEVGLLNRAAPHSGPRPDLDPDIVAALDDDFNFDDPDNELEDDFIAVANGIPSDAETEYFLKYSNLFYKKFCSDNLFDSDEDDEGSSEGDEENDVLCDMRSDSDRLSADFNDDNKSRFTEYSMTSSVIRRNAQLSLLDDRFEQLMAQYDDDEMGALDCEEIEGHISLQDTEVLKLADAFEKDKTEGLRLNQKIGKVARGEVEDAVERYLDKYDSEEDDSSSSEEGEPERKWDCESILSTYSNIYNHPQLISEPRSSKIKVCPRTGVPLNVLGKPGLTKKFLDQLNQETGEKEGCVETQSIISTLSTISIRPKDETPEQRKDRKQLVKEYRRERRKEKKANALAFKEEKKVQEKQNMNNRVNVHGLKLL